MYLHIQESDNVAVAAADLLPGQEVALPAGAGHIGELIPAGHKFALMFIEKGTDVIKYGSPIGTATQDIAPGSWVHTHNLVTKLAGTLQYHYQPLQPEPTVAEPLSFAGYLRPDDRAGTRNEIWVLPTVSCTNQTAALAAEQAWEQLQQAGLAGGIDGIYAFRHPFGCSQLGEDHKNTQKILAALAQHPNAGGVLFLGLGCENNHIAAQKDVLGNFNEQRIRFLAAQDVDDEIAAAVSLLLELASYCRDAQREELPLSYLTLGLKCGGSDGFSGITANPLVGKISDRVIAAGGSSLLTEVPEMFGAEQLLMNRAENEAVFRDIVALINGFKQYYLDYGQPVYENPSPGNKDGGITTLEDKSLGCTEKGGTSPVVDVIRYGDRRQKPGLSLLESPGNDLVAVTALAAAGAQLILFTTGRGTPLGTCVPTIKIATNSRLFSKKRHWMDFDAGTLLTGAAFPQAAAELLATITAAASGRFQTASEVMNFREISPWKQGVTL